MKDVFSGAPLILIEAWIYSQYKLCNIIQSFIQNKTRLVHVFAVN